MRLSQIPPNSAAQLQMSPAGCPVTRDLLLRLPDGSFEPPVDVNHPTFTRPGYQAAADFRLLAEDLTPADFELLRRCQPRTVQALLLATAIGEARTAQARLDKLITTWNLGEARPCA